MSNEPTAYRPDQWFRSGFFIPQEPMPHEFDTVYDVVTSILSDGRHDLIDARLGDMASRDDLSREHMLAFIVATMPHRGWLENRSAFLNNVHNVLVARGEYDGVLEGL